MKGFWIQVRLQEGWSCQYACQPLYTTADTEKGTIRLSCWERQYLRLQLPLYSADAAPG
jgi:hypothetical protein